MQLAALILSALAATSPTTLPDLYGEEYPTIVEAAQANDCTDEVLFCTLLAIRHAENGRAGIEFGVLHPRAVDKPNSLRVQAGWCAATVSKNFARWLKANGDDDFLMFLGRKYCPVGADNDPDGLNKHWVGNVRALTERNLRTVRLLAKDTRFNWPTAKEFNDASNK